MSYQDIFTPEEWTNLKDVMKPITQSLIIPENQMKLVWNAYQRISKDNSHIPCACKNLRKYWINAVNVINDFIKKQENQ